MATLPVPALAEPGEEALRLLIEFRQKYEALTRANRLQAFVPVDSYKDLYEWATQILTNRNQQQKFGGGSVHAEPHVFLPSPRMEEELVPEESESETHLMRQAGPLRLSLRKRQR
jgi:hypothetical protein